MHRPHRLSSARHRSSRVRLPTQRLLPLGALAAGFGLLQRRRAGPGGAGGARGAASAAPPGATARKDGTMLQPISVKAKVETDQNSVRATTSTIGRGNQELRDIPQSVTVVTEKLMEDRRVDTREGGAALHRRHQLPGGRGRRGGHPPARLLAAPPAATSSSTACATRRSTSATSSTSTASRCCAARPRCCSGAARPAASSTRSARQPLLADVSEVSASVGSGSYLPADRRLQPQDRRRRRRCASTR